MSAWLPILLLAALSASAHTACEFQIRRSRVLNAWQSSYFTDTDRTCFSTRNPSAEESAVSNKQISFKFFHSADRSQADSGFHWFAVQLNESVLIRSVTVKGREDAADFVYPRARGIEIWTSGSSSQIFSGEHCSSKSMSSQFSESHQLWRLCGVTESKQKVIAAGEIFTVNCTAEVRQLLLRRDIREANASSYHDFMSFADLRLQTVQLMAFSQPQLVEENSSFEVTCALHCNGSRLSTSSSHLQLCSPSGSCTADQRLQIDRAQPLHSGSYTCNVGLHNASTMVTVLYPPSSVSISVLNAGNCKKSPLGLVVQFNSSASQPVPEHRCSADAGGIRVQNLTRLSQSSRAADSVSYWLFSTDEEQRLGRRSGSVRCSAVQTLPHGVWFQSVHSASARWSCSEQVGSAFSSPFFFAGFAAATASVGILIAVLALFGVIRCSPAMRPPSLHCCQAVAVQEPRQDERLHLAIGARSFQLSSPGTTAEYENTKIVRPEVYVS